MATEITQLTIKTVFVAEGFGEGVSEAKEFGKALTQTAEKALSTFSQLSKALELIGQQLQDKGQKLSIFGLEFDVLKDKTGTLKDLSEAIDDFKEALVGSNQEALRSFTEFLKFITNLITRVEQVLPGLVQFLTIFTGVSATLLLLTPIIAAVVAGVTALAGVFGLPALAIVGIIGIISALVTILLDLRRTFESIKGPIIAVLETIIGPLERFKELIDFIKRDSEDTRTKNEALFKSIKENQKNNPPIGGFQQLIKPDKATQQAMEQTKQQTTALGGLSTANREAKKDIEKTNEALAQNGAANQAASGGVAGNAAALKDYSNTAGSTINPIEQLNDGLRDQITELQFQIEAVGKSGDELIELEAKQKLAEGASADLVTRWKELEKALDIAKKQEEFVGSIEDLIESTKEERETLGLTGDELREYKIRALEAKLSTEEFTNEGLKKAQEELANLREETEKLNTAELAKKFEDLQFSLLPESDQERIRFQETLDFLDEFAKKRTDLEQEIASVRVQVTEEANEKIQDLERKEYIQRLKDSGGFIDGIKAGFLEFVDSVENNSELISQFFADTLSQMSQNFRDLFFNLITGKFDDLADLAKQAFEAISEGVP